MKIADGEIVATNGSRRQDGRSFARARRNSDDREDHECREGGQWKFLNIKVEGFENAQGANYYDGEMVPW